MGRAPASGRPPRSRSLRGLLTPTQYARHRGVSKQGVAKAIRDGRIPTLKRGGRKLVDPAIADPAWLANTDPGKPKGPHSGTNGSAAPAPGTVAAQTLALNEVRTRIAELEFAKKAGLVVDAGEVERHAFDRARAAQKALLSIPARLPLNEEQRRILRLELLGVCELIAGEASSEEEKQEPAGVHAIARN